MQRARSDEAKTERLLTILEAAAALFDEFGRHLTLAQVATAAGLSRTTLYGYANTKEELLLLLTGSELQQFARIASSSAVSGLRPAESVASAVNALPRFAPLLLLSGPVLESNVSYEAVMAWKQQVHLCLHELGATFDMTTESATGTGARFLLHAYASVTGLFAVASPAAIAVKAIDDAELHMLRIEFRGELFIALTAIENMLFNSKSPTTKSRIVRKATP
jgi:AcrR family transcriptional regulator